MQAATVQFKMDLLGDWYSPYRYSGRACTPIGKSNYLRSRPYTYQQMGVRQLSVNNSSTHSWTKIVKELLALCELLSACGLLHSPPLKSQGKTTLIDSKIQKTLLSV